jgi:hypothetical protein
MTWRYEQSTGRLWHLVGTGYSGRDEAKNQPDLESVRNRGPIPRGKWRIAGRYDSPRRGPLCLQLEPGDGTDTLGRSAFLIHGDSIKAPGTASEGCIIMPRAVRQAVWDSGDRDLEVVR